MAQRSAGSYPAGYPGASAAMRRPSTDLFTRIRAIAAHEEC